jgi:hypothetical protein
VVLALLQLLAWNVWYWHCSSYLLSGFLQMEVVIKRKQKYEVLVLSPSLKMGFSMAINVVQIYQYYSQYNIKNISEIFVTSWASFLISG